LLGHADRMLAKRPGHVPLPPPIPASTSRPSGFVELPPSMQRDAMPYEITHAINQAIPGTIKPASEEALPVIGHANTARKVLRGEAGAQPATMVASEDAPLPLAPLPFDEKAARVRHKDRHEHILNHVVNGSKPADIVHSLASKFQITPRAARDTLRRWLEMRRDGFHRAEKEGGPERLARKTPTGLSDVVKNVYSHFAGTRVAKHLADLYVQFTSKGRKATYNEKGQALVERDKNDPLLKYVDEHPEFAHHVFTPAPGEEFDTSKKRLYPEDKEIADLAKAILTHGPKANQGKGINGGDAFMRLHKLLKQQNHPLANAYNWSRMGETLKFDERVRDFVARHVRRPEDMRDSQFWSRVVSSYSREALDNFDANKRTAGASGSAREAQLRARNEFWWRVVKEFGHVGLKKFNDSLYRHHALAEDRDDTELTAANESGKAAVADLDKPWNTGKTGKGKKAVTGNAALKFSESMATLAILASLNPRVRRELMNRGVKFNG
jgi:hypothetical protein